MATLAVAGRLDAVARVSALSCGEGRGLLGSLAVRGERWMLHRERCLYASFAPGAFMEDASRKRCVLELCVRVGPDHNGAGDTKDAEAPSIGVVGFRLDDGVVRVFQIPSEHVDALEVDILGPVLGGMDMSEAMVEVYIPPSASAPHRRDSWWSSHYVKIKRKKQEKASSAYLHYRENIDDLILMALEEFVLVEETPKIDVAELCAGDGSLAACMLEEIGEERISSYTMFERNAQLVEQSIEKTLGCGVCVVESVQIDACSCEGLSTISTLDPKVDVWIASGSVLCGQVGDWHNAAATLRAMVASLKHGGFMVITGFTQSFLHPRLLQQLNLRVVQGSLPSNEAGDLESGFQRFHMFVLFNEGSSDEDSCKAVRHESTENERFLRQFMLGSALEENDKVAAAPI
eukprot:g2571.t1